MSQPFDGLLPFSSHCVEQVGANAVNASRRTLSRFSGGAAAMLLVVAASLGCESSAPKDAPASGGAKSSGSKSTGAPEKGRQAFDLDAMPVDPISIEEFFKDRTTQPQHMGKRVTWRCVLERVAPFHESSGSFTATGFPVEFEGLKEPAEDKAHLGEYSKRYNEYATKEIARVSDTVTFFFEDRKSHEKLKDAKGKRVTISGVASPGPLNGSADLKHCRVISLDH